MFIMDYLEGYTPFNQVLSRLPHFEETDIPAKIDSVATYHSHGYYKDVYKIAQSAAAQFISILGITGIFNIDLSPGNILVSPDFDTKVIDFGININLQAETGREQILQHFIKYNEGLLSSIERLVNANQRNLLHFLDSLTGIPSSPQTIVRTFSSCYNEIISNIATHIDSLLNTETTQETKRQIVFKVLMFLAFIDGLIMKQTFGIDNLQTRVLMKYVFNCEIFNNLTTFCMSSSFNYMKFLDNAFDYRILYITNIIRAQYTRLCNTILDKICENVIGLLSKTCELRRGGSVISKKIFTKRRPRRKSSATKRRRRRRRRTSRK
jgi:serine/threonine protein kinase